MQIAQEKAAKIQELLKKLSASRAFESVAITKEIQKIAAETREQPKIERSNPEPAPQR